MERRNADLRVHLEAKSREHIASLLAVVTALNEITDLTNAEINDNPAAVLKDVARECKTIARQTARIARLVVGAFDDDEVGEDPEPPIPPPQ